MELGGDYCWYTNRRSLQQGFWAKRQQDLKKKYDCELENQQESTQQSTPSLILISPFLSASFPIHCISVTQVTEWQMAFHPLLTMARDARPLSSAFSVSHLSAPNYFLPLLILIPFSLDRNSDWPSFAPNINRQWQGCNVSSLLSLWGSRHPKRCWLSLLCSWFLHCT